jgi:hypothetical protein
VWGYDYYGDDRTLDTHIKLLRKSLGPYAALSQRLEAWATDSRAEHEIFKQIDTQVEIFAFMLAFCAILLDILWLFQTVLLDAFYRASWWARSKAMPSLSVRISTTRTCRS